MLYDKVIRHTDAISILSLSLIICFLIATQPSVQITKASTKNTRNMITISVDTFKLWDRTKRPFPCVTDTDNSNNEGVFYVKIPRTSAKGVSVTQRLTGMEARLLNLPPETNCKTQAFRPVKASQQQQIVERNKEKSFLWSMIRSPDQRAISHFGLRLRTNEVEPTTESFLNDLRTSVPYQPNVEVRFLSMQNVNPHESHENYALFVDDILSEYNFIAIEERMRESLVTLSMLIDVPVNHISYDFSRCLRDTDPEWLTPEMKVFLESKEWKQRQLGDYMLYDSVNKALDLTIKQFDPKEFSDRLEEYDNLKLC